MIFVNKKRVKLGLIPKFSKTKMEGKGQGAFRVAPQGVCPMSIRLHLLGKKIELN